MIRSVALALTLVMLASCGKKGSPAVPGPAEEVVYPKTYPSR